MTGTEARLQVASLFLSVDGEINARGQGTPSLFIRLAGCNLRCWAAFGGCDTPHALSGGRSMSVAEILAEVDAAGCPKATLTGGEPLLQRGPALAALLLGLADRGVFVSMETNGTIGPDFVGRELVGSLVYDCKCPSTGCADAMIPFDDLFRSLTAADCIKFVIRDEDDRRFAWDRIRHARELESFSRPVLAVSPMLPAADPRVSPAALAERLLADRLYEARLNLQIHKYVWPDATGEV